MDLEYGDEVELTGGCGATLHNVFWYFGGEYLEYTTRQVKLQKIFVEYFFHFRQLKLLDAS